MSGSRTRGGGENVPGIPGACAPAILRIWQEAHFSIPHKLSEVSRHCLQSQIDAILIGTCMNMFVDVNVICFNLV